MPCTCGHSINDHCDPDDPRSSACSECDCNAYEPDHTEEERGYEFAPDDV